jgi:uncharacterized protein with PIN domain
MERFICDAMLGKLAKWLRVLGYDTTYRPDLDDAELVRLSWLEGRIILTRDTRLAARKVARRNLVIAHDHVERQLEQVVKQLRLKVEQTAFTRCLVCNEELFAVDKEAVRNLVPPFVFATHDSFARCPNCGRHYWKGTHWQQMLERLRKVASPDQDVADASRNPQQSRPDSAPDP